MNIELDIATVAGTVLGASATMLVAATGWFWKLLRDARMEMLEEIRQDREACHAALEKLNDRVTSNLILVQGNYVTIAAMDVLRTDIRDQFNGFRDDMRSMFRNGSAKA